MRSSSGSWRTNSFSVPEPSSDPLSMAAIQPFLARLGLDASADERAIRRAYAQRLKAVDPAQDPRGFQSLRESYEAALAWAKRARPRAPRALPAAPEGREAAEEPLPAPAVVTLAETRSIERPALSSGPPPAAPARETPLPARPAVATTPFPGGAPAQQANLKAPRPPARPISPHTLAKAVFSVLCARNSAWSGRWTYRTEVSAQAELEACLRDPRLLNLTARSLFEQRVVDHLAKGPTPGRKALFAAASRTFGWILDRRRLDRFGDTGRKLNHEIDSTSLIVLGGEVGFRASLLRQWRFYRARRKRVRIRLSKKKQWIWLAAVVLIYILVAVINNLDP